MPIHCSVTALFHIAVTLGNWMVNMSKKMFLTTLMLMFILFGTTAAATSLAFPGYVWGKWSVSGDNSITNGTFNQGIKWGNFPLIPYGEVSYYRNSLDLGGVTTTSGGFYAQLWNTPFKLGVCYAQDKATNSALSKEQIQGFITLYKEWNFK